MRLVIWIISAILSLVNGFNYKDQMVQAHNVDFTTFGKIIFKSHPESSAKTPTLSITSGDFGGVLMAQTLPS